MNSLSYSVGVLKKDIGPLGFTFRTPRFRGIYCAREALSARPCLYRR